jgi:hypothetical protein
MSADLDSYKNNLVELIGWGKSHILGKTSNALKRVSLQVFPQV